jgi:predicted nicotinamide N-methyase
MTVRPDTNPSSRGCVPGLPDVPGGWTERDVEVAGKRYHLMLPAAPDLFLDDPSVQERHASDGYMPYWAFLWPASLPMAELVARHAWPAEAMALEIGCGTGLVGLVAGDHGLRVVLSDYQPDAVDAALFNARRNGRPNLQRLVLDWRSPPERKFSVILGCDVIYEIRDHGPILSLLRSLLTEDGIAWLGDGGRQTAEPFIRDAQAAGFVVELRDAAGRRLVEPHVGRFQLIALSGRQR